MIFNSLIFLVFFVVLFLLYWIVLDKKLKYQNLLILSGSYFFYAWADWRFLFFLIAVSVLNFILGIQIEKSTSDKRKKILLYIGLIQGIGGLAFFKYYNFFVTSIKDAFSGLNIQLDIPTLHILIPLGISFFSFRTISYLLDIEKGKIEASKDWIVFFAYVAFFPSLLSGPIDKSRTFIPQLEKQKVFDYNQIVDGFRQILWGLFKKVVIADTCAEYTNIIFNNSDNYSGSTLFLGAFFYSFQMYSDFSGYSDMAIGVSRLMGFNITKNFDFPFFAQNIADYWRKWHISLTIWLTEYVFTPLSIAFRDYGNFGLVLAIVINFVICGIWHGANWTYVLFGLLHGLYFIPLILNGTMNKKKKIEKGKLIPTFREVFNMLKTFLLVTLTFIVFRAKDLHQVGAYFSGIFSKSFFSVPEIKPPHVFILILVFMTIEWFGKDNNYAIEKFALNKNVVLRWSFYFLLIIFIFLFSGNEQEFIYFKF
jgi:alginate O-acetyltransferase complex protein AlgI